MRQSARDRRKRLSSVKMTRCHCLCLQWIRCIVLSSRQSVQEKVSSAFAFAYNVVQLLWSFVWWSVRLKCHLSGFFIPHQSKKSRGHRRVASHKRRRYARAVVQRGRRRPMPAWETFPLARALMSTSLMVAKDLPINRTTDRIECPASNIPIAYVCSPSVIWRATMKDTDREKEKATAVIGPHKRHRKLCSEPQFRVVSC